MHVFQLKHLEDATDGFSPSRLIGKGSHGCVYRGVLGTGVEVAVKKQSLGLQKLQDNTKLENEALILSSILPNPCIVNFLGIAHDDSRRTILVTEYMPHGTLHHLIHASAAPPSWQKRVEIALRLASALQFLHESSPPVVHRDVKSVNVLFDEDWGVKLVDFGLATWLHDEVVSMLPAGTIGYLDPSYTSPRELSTKIDVFSYGVVLLELVSGRKAIDLRQSPASLVDWAKGCRVVEICDKRVPLSRRVCVGLLDVAFRCVSGVRPSMKEVVAGLESLMKEPIQPCLWSLDYVREKVEWMMRKRRRKSWRSCNNSKGRLLISEILSDITLK